MAKREQSQTNTPSDSQKREHINSEESTSAKTGLSEPQDSSQSPRWSGGSWRGQSSKAKAVAGVAKESISAAANKTSETVQSKVSANGSTKRLSDKLRSPSKSTPTTQLSTPTEEKGSVLDQDSSKSAQNELKEVSQQDDPGEDGTYTQEKVEDRPLPAQGWRGWWSRPRPVAEERKDQDTSFDASKQTTQHDDCKDTMSKGQDRHGPLETNDQGQKDSDNAVGDDLKPDTKPISPKAANRASWFGLWGLRVGTEENAASPSISQKGSPVEPTASNVASDGFTVMDQDQRLSSGEGQNQSQSRGSGGWAFWSKEPVKKENEAEAVGENGELAIVNTKSETQPKPAHVVREDERPISGRSTPKNQKKTPSPPSVEQSLGQEVEKSSKRKSTDNKDAKTEMPSASDSSAVEDSKHTADKSLSKIVQKYQRNLLLPPLQNTFHVAESPSYWQQISRLFARSKLTDTEHLFLNASPPKIHKALAIGVHGYFPAPMIARVLGQPTGTSLRFANGAAEAIEKWSSAHKINCEIEKVALEGEGTVAHRVDTLWKLLLNWVEAIRKADFIFIACHSQGVPVAIELLARLINYGDLKSSARLATCCMAGVNLGPFPSYQSRFLGNGAMNELFDFAHPSSQVSSNYSTALSTCLKHHVRVFYVGSIDDQLVSLESSLYTPVSHPYIYRAVFIDGRIHAPGFISSLVGLACKLRNLGIADHGLIRELSGPLAGSLYTGEGHSRIYEDPAVYDLAVEYALETSNLSSSTTLDGVPVEVEHHEIPNQGNSNPYFLPWALRGVLEEDFVKTELKEETGELLGLFERWKPQSKVLKDVKFRLEAVRSKL